MDNKESEDRAEKPHWQKPEIVTEEISSEFVVLSHCNESPGDGCSTYPTVTP